MIFLLLFMIQHVVASGDAAWDLMWGPKAITKDPLWEPIAAAQKTPVTTGGDAMWDYQWGPKSNSSKTRLWKSPLMVLVVSKRENEERRQMIRDTWAKDHDNVFFMVGEHYCPIPQEKRVDRWTCPANTANHLRSAFETSQDELTKRLKKEPKVILLNMHLVITL